LTRQADWTREQIDATKAETQKLAAESTRWKTIADAEHENMENTRVQGGRKAQRLQQQISLYASTTGIKWHYLEEETLKKNGEGSFLIGEVVRRVNSPHCRVGQESVASHLQISSLRFQDVPSESTIRQFQIDREMHSRYEIAAQLWSLMNGQALHEE
jgi:hypothetical protein